MHTFTLLLILLCFTFVGGCGGWTHQVRPEGFETSTEEGIGPPLTPPEPKESTTFRPDPSNDLIPATRRKYQNPVRATKEDFIDHYPEEGSLWPSNGHTQYYITKNQTRSIGDMITLTLEQDLYQNIIEEIKQTLSVREKILEIEELQNTLKPFTQESNTQPPLSKTSETAQLEKDTKNEKDQKNRASFSNVNLASSMSIKTGDTLVGEILEKYPNGNYKILAMKRIPYKNGRPRVVSVVGIVKSTEIQEGTDRILSGKLYDDHVEVTHAP